MDIVYIDKVDNENKIEVLLRLQPSNLKVWDEVNFADMIELNSPVPITDIQITRNPDGTVKVVFKYEADIQGVQIEAKLNPAGTGNPTLMRAVPSSQNLLIESKDNEGAYFYDEQTYNIANIISLLCTAASAIGLTFFLIGMIYGKMIAVEMMAVLQVSFLSLLNLTQVNPCFAALSSLRLANGFNLIVTSKDYLIND